MALNYFFYSFLPNIIALYIIIYSSNVHFLSCLIKYNTRDWIFRLKYFQLLFGLTLPNTQRPIISNGCYHLFTPSYTFDFLNNRSMPFVFSYHFALLDIPRAYSFIGRACKQFISVRPT
jgi:hypothetical protein